MQQTMQLSSQRLHSVISVAVCRTIREIRRDMHKQREWRNELEKMKIGNVVGSLSVESKTLRASLVPVTQRTLEQVGHAIRQWHHCLC
jgi:hypothetical protein